MKKSILGVTVIFTASMFLASCSSESNVLSQFSKRKYLKNVKENKYQEKHKVEALHYAEVKENKETNAIVEKEIQSTIIIETKDETALLANEIKQEIKKPTVIKNNKQVKKAFTAWRNETANLSVVEANVKPNTVLNLNKAALKNSSSSDVHPVVLVLLSIFLPPLAVYLFQDSIENDFWLDLILIIFFWIPSIIYALLVIYGGVSIN